MGQNKDKNFKKRFGDRITVVYLPKPLNLSDQKIQNGKITKTLSGVLGGLLKRPPTQEELLGLEDLSAKKRKRKDSTPP